MVNVDGLLFVKIVSFVFEKKSGFEYVIITYLLFI